MSFRKFIYASLAVAGVVNAQCKGDVVVESDGDVMKIADCTSITGDFTVGKGLTSLSLPKLDTVGGDFKVEGAVGLTSIEAGALSTIKGSFTLSQLTVLSTMSMPQLSSVGTISWSTLPALQSVVFTKTVTKADAVTITDTQLNSLEGINLTTVKIFDINNNKYLKSVDVGLGSVSEAISIDFNSKSVKVSFPKLVWATNVTIRDAGEVSFPILETVNSSMAFVNNSFTSAMFPKLTQVGSSLSFVSNSQLTTVNCTKLEKIGGTFQLANNTKLEVVEGFGSLSTVSGSIDFSGTFKNASLPELEDVRGGFNLQSTEDFDCSTFNNLKGGVVKGKFDCRGALSEASSADGSTTTTGGSGSKGGNKTSAATQDGVNVAYAFAAVGAVLFSL